MDINEEDKNTVTLKDIAEKAGVSPGAVSFVLNNTHKERRISQPTVDKVRKIAREMGYHPNIAARNLRFFGPERNLFVLSIITSAESPLHLVSHSFIELQKRLRHEEDGRTYVTNISTFEPGRIREIPGSPHSWNISRQRRDRPRKSFSPMTPLKKLLTRLFPPICMTIRTLGALTGTFCGPRQPCCRCIPCH